MLIYCATARNVYSDLIPNTDAGVVIKALVRLLKKKRCIKMVISGSFSSFKLDEISNILFSHNIDWTFLNLCLHGGDRPSHLNQKNGRLNMK